MTLITLYDVGAYVAMLLAHGALPALLAVADDHLSRAAARRGSWQMSQKKGVGEAGILWPG